MSCAYPSCQIGGGGCPYESQCDAEFEKKNRAAREQRDRDIAEQEARTRLMNAQADAIKSKPVAKEPSE